MNTNKNKDQGNLTNKKQGSQYKALQEQEAISNQKDGIRYDYDDSSDLKE